MGNKQGGYDQSDSDKSGDSTPLEVSIVQEKRHHWIELPHDDVSVLRLSFRRVKYSHTVGFVVSDSTYELKSMNQHTLRGTSGAVSWRADGMSWIQGKDAHKFSRWHSSGDTYEFLLIVDQSKNRCWAGKVDSLDVDLTLAPVPYKTISQKGPWRVGMLSEYDCNLAAFRVSPEELQQLNEGDSPCHPQLRESLARATTLQLCSSPSVISTDPESKERASKPTRLELDLGPLSGTPSSADGSLKVTIARQNRRHWIELPRDDVFMLRLSFLQVKFSHVIGFVVSDSEYDLTSLNQHTLRGKSGAVSWRGDGMSWVQGVDAHKFSQWHDSADFADYDFLLVVDQSKNRCWAGKVDRLDADFALSPVCYKASAQKGPWRIGMISEYNCKFVCSRVAARELLQFAGQGTSRHHPDLRDSLERALAQATVGASSPSEAQPSSQPTPSSPPQGTPSNGSTSLKVTIAKEKRRHWIELPRDDVFMLRLSFLQVKFSHVIGFVVSDYEYKLTSVNQHTLRGKSGAVSWRGDGMSWVQGVDAHKFTQWHDSADSADYDFLLVVDQSKNRCWAGKVDRLDADFALSPVRYKASAQKGPWRIGMMSEYDCKLVCSRVSLRELRQFVKQGASRHPDLEDSLARATGTPVQPSAYFSPSSSQTSPPPSSPTSQPATQPSSPSTQPAIQPSTPSSQPATQPPAAQPSPQPAVASQPAAQPSSPSPQPAIQPSTPFSQPATQLPAAQPSPQPAVASQPAPQPSSRPVSTQQAAASMVTLTSSNFLKIYSVTQEPQFQHELLAAVQGLILSHCKQTGTDEAMSTAFFLALQREQFKFVQELLDEVSQVARRMWTSAQVLRAGPVSQRKEFCSILNQAIRDDVPAQLAHAAVIVRAINQLCVTRRDKSLPYLCKTYRGGTLPDEHKPFFTEGKSFRVPMFLATSGSEDIAEEFLYRSHMREKAPGVLWIFLLDPRGVTKFKYRCKHVNLVQRSNVEGEAEYLFAPYSAFTVEKVAWSANPDDRTPHVITLKPVIDNRDAPEDLPLSPWS